MPKFLKSLEMDRAVLAKALPNSSRIVEVYAGSPAEAVGIRAGWHVLPVDNLPFSDDRLQHLRFGKKHTFRLYDKMSERCFELPDSSWPLGLKLSNVGTAGFKKRVRRRQDIDEELFDAFGRGDLYEFGNLVDDFRGALSPEPFGVLSRHVKAALSDKIVSRSGDFQYLAFLSVAYLELRQFSRAHYFLNAAQAQMHKSGQQSFTLLLTAMLSFVEASLAWEVGDREKGLVLMEAAVSEAPQYELLRDTLSIWTDSPPLLYAPRWVGEPFLREYSLPCYDPLGFWPAGERTGLCKMLSAMKSDQIAIIFLMPNYRANYYYNVDLIALSALHGHNRKRIAAIHVISDSDYMLSPTHASEAERTAKAWDLPIHFLDGRQPGMEGATLAEVSNDLGLYRSPTTLVLDKAGTVLANGVFMDESAYWNALLRLEH